MIAIIIANTDHRSELIAHIIIIHIKKDNTIYSIILNKVFHSLIFRK